MARSVVLFLHVLSAMGVFAALGIEAAALSQVAPATRGVNGRGAGAALASVLGGLRAAARVGMVSLPAAVLSGAYLAAAIAPGLARAGGGWVGVSLAGLVGVAILGATLTRRASADLAVLAHTAHAARVALDPSAEDAARTVRAVRALGARLWASWRLRAALLVGVVFLMTVKPGVPGSLAALGTAVGAAFAAGSVARVVGGRSASGVAARGGIAAGAPADVGGAA